MGCPGPMTGFADKIFAASGRCARVSLDAMDIFPKVFINLLMTLQASLIAHIIFFILTAVGVERKG